MRGLMMAGLLVLAGLGVARAEEEGTLVHWKTIRTTNGMIYRLGVTQIEKIPGGGAQMPAWVNHGDGWNPENLELLQFNCHGSFRRMMPDITEWNGVPPNSVGKIAEKIACK